MKYFLPVLLFLFSLPVAAQNVGIGTITPTDQLHTTGTVRLQNYSGRSTRIAQIDTAGRLVAPAAGKVHSDQQFHTIAIPDNGCSANNGAVAQIQVVGEPVTLVSSKIAVRFNITHPYNGDLFVVLQSPGGAILNLISSNGGNSSNFTNTIFTDESPALLAAGAAPFTGSYKPNGFNGTQCTLTPTVSTFSAIGGGTLNPNGVWTLRVYDIYAGDIGTLDSWDITFTGPEGFGISDQNRYIPLFLQGGLRASSLY